METKKNYKGIRNPNVRKVAILASKLGEVNSTYSEAYQGERA